MACSIKQNNKFLQCDKIKKKKTSYKDVQKFQDAFVGKYVQNISWFWIDNR